MNCFKYGQTIIMRSSWFINTSRGTFEKVWMICLSVGAGLKQSHRRASVCKRDEKTSSDCQKKEIPSAWHLNPLFEADKEKELRWKIKQAASSFLLRADRESREPGSVSSQTHPPMWPANHCTEDTKLVWRKSQENTKPSAALISLNE